MKLLDLQEARYHKEFDFKDKKVLDRFKQDLARMIDATTIGKGVSFCLFKPNRDLTWEEVKNTLTRAFGQRNEWGEWVIRSANADVLLVPSVDANDHQHTIQFFVNNH